MTKKTIQPTENIVASMVPEFKKELYESIMSENINELEINLQAIEMIDSVGLGVFIGIHNSISQKGGRLIVTNASSDIYNLFKTMRLNHHFKITSS
ncbi:Anti-sigma-factor antagonist [Candidatus Magnetomoraceae bacterium gMMP-15]